MPSNAVEGSQIVFILIIGQHFHTGIKHSEHIEKHKAETYKHKDLNTQETILSWKSSKEKSIMFILLFNIDSIMLHPNSLRFFR